MAARSDPPSGQHIDITRPYEILATCPTCGMQRHLPEDWQTIMRSSIDPRKASDWDGQLRCARDRQVMTLVPIRNPKIEPDGSVIVHLVMDNDPRRAACTEQPWAGVPDNLPAGTVLRQCQACATLVWRGTT